ncbi:hypothetical protein HNP38_003184 [Chryseobacterium defluvii]|uniref:Uncharacterized protein n=1 Tax=Chryseobacterium defluvii TaxID=160396 RepID=A0A840KIL9_9FLAO|nr:helix-turn-helix domain-containing protein [Chryseobacterium defluvii]MBB4807868.1 hypothetical protein [Chryseobacterium defluvii]
MSIQIQKAASPDYKRIYHDIIIKKYPDKKDKCQLLLEKQDLSALDIIKLNSLIFGKTNREFNQRYKSYSRSAIREILKYQAENNLNNTQLAHHFKLSRNTVTKWKRLLLG